MSHAVLFLTYLQVPEQLALAKEAWESLVRQDVGDLEIWAINNGGSAEAKEWIDSLSAESPTHITVHARHCKYNTAPTVLVNNHLEEIFEKHEYVLSLPPDVILPPNLYREFLRWPRGLVTGSQVSYRDFPLFEKSHVVSEHTPMAVSLTRKWMHQALVAKDGYFNDPCIFLYASDNDMALRLSMCGIRGVQLDLQYYHFCSSSWRMLSPEKGQLITGQADSDRKYFELRWGFRVDSNDYLDSSRDINFRGKA